MGKRAPPCFNFSRTALYFFSFMIGLSGSPRRNLREGSFRPHAVRQNKRKPRHRRKTGIQLTSLIHIPVRFKRSAAERQSDPFRVSEKTQEIPAGKKTIPPKSACCILRKSRFCYNGVWNSFHLNQYQPNWFTIYGITILGGGEIAECDGVNTLNLRHDNLTHATIDNNEDVQTVLTDNFHSYVDW